ncbi:hypothetical protein [Metabacillus sp. 84]|uniref:hypothetical protein n=1 Tax=Metabacillus sp. 84 TaxID=3404705 RepID=UPI003CED9777
MAKPKYEALIKFKDMEDDGKLYKKGDRFPKPANKKVEDDRISELLSSENKAGKPVIKEV